MNTTYLDALQTLPVAAPAEFLRGRRVIVVAPHPDDESLGLGGTIAAAVDLGSPVAVVFLTSGEGSHTGSPTYPEQAVKTLREAEACEALERLGVPARDIVFLRLPDSGLEAMDTSAARAAVASIQVLMDGEEPVVLLVTADTDAHGDHRAAARLVRSVVLRPGDRRYGFPVWTFWQAPDETDPPGPEGVRLDIEPYLPAKRAAIAAHRSQHGLVIRDAREAFVLDPRFVDAMCSGYETLVAYG